MPVRARLTFDGALRIAVNVAKLPVLVDFGVCRMMRRWGRD
jgi:hypothetical protein